MTVIKRGMYSPLSPVVLNSIVHSAMQKVSLARLDRKISAALKGIMLRQLSVIDLGLKVRSTRAPSIGGSPPEAIGKMKKRWLFEYIVRDTVSQISSVFK